MIVETNKFGVVSELNGKFWGVQSDSGGSTSYGFGPIEKAIVSTPKHCSKPTDMTWNPESCYNPWFEQLSKAKLVFLSVNTKYETHETIGAEDRASQLYAMKPSKIPRTALEYARYLCSKYGSCGEIFITAYAHYAQLVEGLTTNDALYKIDEEGKAWFNEHSS
jgi:hypothetical protein